MKYSKDIEPIIRRIITEQLNVSDYDKTKSDLKREYSLVDDLGADSLDIVEIILSFEDEFNIEITEEDIRVNHVDTIGDCIEIVKNKISNDTK